MARYRLCRNQQTGANIFAQVDILVWRQQRDCRFVAASNGNKAVHKALPALLQIHAPFANGAGELFAVGVHRGVVIVIVGKAQVINLVSKLVDLENDTVVVDLADGRQRRDIVGNGAAGANQTGIVHIGEAGIGAF